MNENKDYSDLLRGFFIGYGISCIIAVMSIAYVQAWKSNSIEIIVVVSSCLIVLWIFIGSFYLIAFLIRYKIVRRE